VIEILLGIPVYFLIYTISGISAVALTYILRKNEIMYRALGASGCIVGILFAAIVIAPEIKVGLIFIPVQIPGPFFALIYVAFSLLFMGGQGNIGHEAHLGGALAGFLLGGYFSPNGFTPIIEQFYRIFS
jgi:membrane associated rhomboid family serine protease